MASSEHVLDAPAAPLPSQQLRALPGYTSARGASLAGAANTPATALRHAPATQSKPYHTRERLYYESEASAAAPNGAPSARPQPIAARLAEDAPPVLSLHEYGSLTPERKYAASQDQDGAFGGAEQRSSPASPSRTMQVDDAAADGRVGEGNWVTVFGFAGGRSSEVLAYFRRLGAVEQVQMGQGNWMHIKYVALWAAQKAIAKNGAILQTAGSCMVGVLPMQRALEQVGLASESFMSPLKNEARREPPAADQHDIFLRPGLMSPVVADNVAATPASAVSHLGQSVCEPQGPESAGYQESLVTKALGYIFGW